MKKEIKRIAMWTGPRNISTAMMYSWGNRSDTFVWDEPLYAYYLSKRKEAYASHPGAQEVIEVDEHDWEKVVDRIVNGTIPGGKKFFWQKQMAHHLLPEVSRDWLEKIDHFFLIRDPEEVLLSLQKNLPQATVYDTGIKQEHDIFMYIKKKTGSIPIVVDSKDILKDPRRLLSILCEKLDIPFKEEMLEWKKGPKDFDGVWAKYWYKNVWNSTGFIPYTTKDIALPEHLEDVHEECSKLYKKLYQYRIR